MDASWVLRRDRRAPVTLIPSQFARCAPGRFRILSLPMDQPAPKPWVALIPVGFLVVFLGLSVINLNDLPDISGVSALLRWVASIPVIGETLRHSIPVPIPLIAATAVASIVAWRLGLPWKAIEESYLHGIRLSLGACLILLVIGVLIGTWILGGVVPTMIYYGLKLISPSVFLVATCVICSIVSLASGSSWATAGTVGVAMIGVGSGLGVPLPMVAGAIVSGAYFGDKMSPLSDTTNLAPAVAGSDLFSHVRHMVHTTVPSLAVALVLYGALGIQFAGGNMDTRGVSQILDSLQANFVISPWLFSVPCLVVGLVIMRMPALPALLIGAFAGGLCAMIVQDSPLSSVLQVANDGYAASTGIASVDELLTRGGLSSMFGTLAIILTAMCFGGVMERSGMLGALAGVVLRFAKSTGSLIAATVGTCIGMNIVAPDQYLSIVVPGRMYRDAYQRAGLDPKNLSRALEDAGTLSSPLIPWNTCGAYMSATLGVFSFAYLPYAFLNLICPLVSILYGFTGWTIARTSESGLPGREPVKDRA